MSMLTSENAFLSSLQPHTLSTTYALPSDNQIGNGSAMSDDAVRARRVQEQIKMKLAEKGTLPRQNGKASQYAMSDYGGSSTMKYSNYNPSYSSKSSYMYSGSKTLGPRVSTRADFSSRSAAPDITQFQRMSVGMGGGGGGGFYREEMNRGGFQGSIRQNQMDRDDMSVHSLRNMHTVGPWAVDNSDAGSLISERDGTFDQQYSQSAMNGYGAQIRQGGGTMIYQTGFQTQEPALPTMHRSLSGTLSRGGGLGGGGGTEIIQQQSFKGPSHRTINRIANRNRMSVTSMSGSRMTSSSGNIGAGGDRTDSGFLMSVKSASGNGFQQRQGGMMRSTSMRSVQSVGGGMDIFGQTDLEDNPHLQGIHGLDLDTAVSYLKEHETSLQVLGSAYIQHICYNEKTAKDEVTYLGATKDLVRLFNSHDPEVCRYSTGAVRNMIYQHVANKQDLIEHNGIEELNKALEMEDDELRKNITGILWNLSAQNNLKEKLKIMLPRLTNKILVPLTAQESEKAKMIKEDQCIPSSSPSETEILHNTLGCLRNLSSGTEKVRKELRETKGLVDSLVDFLQSTLDTGKVQEKGAENTMCILRNLSFQLYDEMPPSMKSNMSGDDTTTSSNTVGCFSPNSSKIKEKKSAQTSFSPSEVAKFPKGIERLWHPKIVPLYSSVIKSCEINATTREAGIGALQNITGGQEPWAGKLSRYIVNEQKMLPTLMDLFRSERTAELRSLSGLLRSLSSHADTTSAMDALVRKLPAGSSDKPDKEVLVSLCGVLNNMVARSFDAAKKLAEGPGLGKLMVMKTMGSDNPDMADASRSAGIVLRNIYNYRKLHKIFRRRRYTKADFCDV